MATTVIVLTGSGSGNFPSDWPGTGIIQAWGEGGNGSMGGTGASPWQGGGGGGSGGYYTGTITGTAGDAWSWVCGTGGTATDTTFNGTDYATAGHNAASLGGTATGGMGGTGSTNGSQGGFGSDPPANSGGGGGGAGTPGPTGIGQVGQAADALGNGGSGGASDIGLAGGAGGATGDPAGDGGNGAIGGIVPDNAGAGGGGGGSDEGLIGGGGGNGGNGNSQGWGAGGGGGGYSLTGTGGAGGSGGPGGIIITYNPTTGSGGANCACCTTPITTACCPDNSVPALLYLAWTSQLDMDYPLPNPIPLTYGMFAPQPQAWVSPCYHDATNNCYTRFGVFCNANGDWQIGSVIMTATCSPFELTAVSVPTAGWQTAGQCATGGAPFCANEGFLTGITVTPTP